MANSATAKEFYNGIHDRAVGTPDTNALDVLIGPGHAFSLALTGTPGGGTFKLTFGDQETGAIAYNADAATVDAAITALSNVGASDVAVTGTNPNFEIVFSGASRFTREDLSLSDNSLTGGTSPSASIAVIAASDNTLMALFETLAAKAAAEFANDREEDTVLGDVISHLWEAAASILANVK